MSDEKELSLTPEGFVWFKCNECLCTWQSYNDESDCPECGSLKIELLGDEEEREKQ